MKQSKSAKRISRRDFLKKSGTAALALTAAPALSSAQAAGEKSTARAGQGPLNILMIVTDQERHLRPDELPIGYRLPGHEKLMSRGVTFDNHQIGSCVCTPSRAVVYTGQHIQHNGRHKLNRYFSPMEHHTPKSVEELFANNDVELFDVKSDPNEMKNLATDKRANGDLIVAMNKKLNALIDSEVGNDDGQMLPSGKDVNWKLDPSISKLRM